jgi:RNA polymerase sigma factor (sigma-70 family)
MQIGQTLCNNRAEFDADAFCTEWFPKLCRIAARRFSNIPADVYEDLAQLTLLWAVQDPENRCVPGKICNYLFSRAIDWLRKRRGDSLDFQNEGALPFTALVADVGSLSEQKYVVRLALDQCISRLTDRGRNVVTLLLAGLSTHEIAQALSIAEGTIGRIFSEVKSNLAFCMTGEKRKIRAYMIDNSARESSGAAEATQGRKR